ncbi:MAG: Gfo/Idh/MocA family protein [Pleomorphochaeta sp.]
MKNLGILGLGNIAANMAKTVCGMDDVTLYAVASRSLEKANIFKEEYLAEVAYGSYEELVMDNNVDLVYIATPHSHHAKYIELALNHNKPVLCEKAFTSNLNEAKKVIALSHEKNVFLAEAIWTRYLPSRYIIEQLLDNGVIGNISLVDSNLGYNVAANERIYKKELAGGALLDLTVYPINFTCMFFGSNISKINSTVIKMKSGVDGIENVNFVYDNGILATFNTSVYSKLNRKGIIYGSKGYIEIENINNPEKISIFDEEGVLVEEILPPEQITGFEYQVRACLEAIEEGQIEPKQMPHSETLRMMEIMDQLRKTWDIVFPWEE